MSTLYLCKLDPETRNPRTGQPKFVALVGRVIRDDAPDGTSLYRFFPETCAHKNSRKFHRTVLKCIPKWTERLGFLRLYDRKEFDEETTNDGNPVVWPWRRHNPVAGVDLFEVS